jgi:hypothetical protein
MDVTPTRPAAPALGLSSSASAPLASRETGGPATVGLRSEGAGDGGRLGGSTQVLETGALGEERKPGRDTDA